MEYQVDETETVHFTISYLYFPNRLLFQLVESKDCLAWRAKTETSDFAQVGSQTVDITILSAGGRPFSPWLAPASRWVPYSPRQDYPRLIEQGTLTPMSLCRPLKGNPRVLTHVHEFGVVDQFSSKRFLSNCGFLLRGSTRTQFTFKLQDPRTFLPPNARFQGKQGPKPRRQCRAQRLFDCLGTDQLL